MGFEWGTNLSIRVGPALEAKAYIMLKHALYGIPNSLVMGYNEALTRVIAQNSVTHHANLERLAEGSAGASSGGSGRGSAGGSAGGSARGVSGGSVPVTPLPAAVPPGGSVAQQRSCGSCGMSGANPTPKPHKP